MGLAKMDDSKLSVLPGHRQRPEAAEGPTSWATQKAASSRHDAIARQLYSYSRYKSWAEKMRSAWQHEEEQAADPAVLRNR
jgi:hypothetical protein